MRCAAAILAPVVLSAVVLAVLHPADTRQEILARHINLGKAFYENPATPKEAAEEFRQALALNPNSAREHLNYGLALLRAGQTAGGVAELEKARSLNPTLPHPYFSLGVVFKREGDFPRSLKEFTEMAKRAPDEPVTHYNLGTLYKLQGQNEKALGEFETAARLDPTLAAPHFQLFNAYRVSKNTEKAQRELAIFQEIKKRQSDLGTSEDMDWCYYSEILDDLRASARGEGAAPVEVVFEEQRLGSVGAQAAGIAALDADADGQLDILAWSADRVVLYRNTGKGFTATPIAGAAGQVEIGDFNNDGFPDLCVLSSGGVQLWANRKGVFTKTEKPLRSGVFHKAVWVDYDHDYDLDLMLLGETQILLRNNGDGSWTDVTPSFPFVAGQALDAAVFELGDQTNTFDVVVAYRDRPAVLYRDRKVGHYEATPLPFSLASPLEVADLNQDGFLDLASGTAFLENRGGNLSEPRPLGSGSPALFADFQNRGQVDLLAGAQMQFHRSGFTYAPGKVRGAPTSWLAATAADFNNDGLTDVAFVGADGSVHLLKNATPTKNGWLKVALAGIKNLKLAAGARVEVKAGSLYEKKLYQGAPLVFGLAGYTQADAVRITWPNGLVQNEPHQAAAANYNYKEAQRLSGSCPMIFTWNGRRFEFISDVLGVAPLGAGLGEGEFFPLDHDEYVQIPGRSLAPRNGAYEIHITEELREVSYLDQIKLIAVDHPTPVEIFTNEKFKSPPFPEFRLFGVQRRVYPARREEERFRRDMNGRAELHSLTLEFPPRARDGVLYLHGWVDWADGSTFVAASQSTGTKLVAPYLQVRDASGRWVTVIDDMGMPAGKPKTIAVDLTGKFLSSSRAVRIVTNMCVYWDDIFLGEDAGSPAVHVTPLTPSAADLHFRGFSAIQVDPERRRPESFDYSVVRPVSMWNPTPGLYTRYGGVRELLDSIDDRFVIMSSGDELRLRFAAGALPPLETGWTRDFLLYVDGWAKDADANTAFGGSVEPLPFHAMRGYPYGPGEHYPDDALNNDYRRVYNTRPALRLIRPLAAWK